jgi:hypothetical protein
MPPQIQLPTIAKELALAHALRSAMGQIRPDPTEG